MSERTKFEEWCREQLDAPPVAFSIRNDEYTDDFVRALRLCWLSSRRQALEEAAKACEALKYDEGDAYANAYYDNALTDAASAIRREAQGE